MIRSFSVVRVLLALFVAVLLPLEQARCACRMPENAQATASHACCMKRAADVAPPALHACCAARAAQAKQSRASHDCGGACTCYSAPAESAPVTTFAPASEAPTLSPLAAIAMCAVLTAPAPTVTVAAPPPDIGGPPLPEAALAHSLRGPPAIR
ncbi:MAG: hypothetical protein U0704_00215 [Candidatus Eisenbacteria bacterium]